MESNRQNIQFCPWCIVWSFLRYFFQIGSECDDPYLKTCTLVDRYQVPPSVETGWSPHFSTILDRKRSATNIFLSFEMLIPRISLFLGSIATHNQMYSEPALMIVSSRTYSSMFFFFDDILWGLYFWIQFQIETWFHLIKQASLSEVLLNDRPEK